jgi:alpha-mannosidase
MEVENIVTLRAGMRRVEFETILNNNADNHRVRVLTTSNLVTDSVEADTPFDVVRRSIVPWEGWTNPTRSGKMQNFFRLSEKNAGIAIAGRGLCEYEVLRDDARTMALTLHRGVHHLGDWGVFPTPDAQCHGTLRVEYALLPFTGEREKNENAAASLVYSAGELAAVSGVPHPGAMKANDALLKIHAPAGILFSAWKQHEDRDSVILRLYSIDDEEKTVKLNVNGRFSAVYTTDMKEERQTKLPLRLGCGSVKIGAHKIVTLELVK